nr:cupredoxin domain-containing protein [uncultured Rhodopila sp.]
MKTVALALLAAFALTPAALAADPWAHAQVVTEVMVDNSFQPDHLTFHSGQPYELRLENRGKDMHEFTAPAFLKAARVRDKRLLANGGTDIVVPSGKSVRIFLIPGPKGDYDLSCADHDWDGMVGGITVD